MSTDALDVLNTAQRLRSQDEPFALVTVLRVQAPASARPGDKAVVGQDGIVQGWIGGGCAQPAVLRTVQAALADGQARLIRITPQAEGSEPDLNAQMDQLTEQLNDVLEFGMACHSGGTLELFVDPVLPRARLTIIGDSPVAVALAGLAPRVGLAVSVIAHGADAARFPDATRVLAQDDVAVVAQAVAPASFVVVATQGRRDVQGLRAALALQAADVWLVASARKAQVLKDALVAAGADAAAVANIVAPAGQAMAAQMGAHTGGGSVVRAGRRGGGAAAWAGGAGGAGSGARPGRSAAAAARTAQSASQSWRQLLRQRHDSRSASRRHRHSNPFLLRRALTWAASSKVVVACTAAWWWARCCWPQARVSAWAAGPNPCSPWVVCR